MASIIKKIKKGRPYYYAVESARVDGKPRIVWQKYLGTIDAIVQRADQARPAKPKETVIFEAGGVAALTGGPCFTTGQTSSPSWPPPMTGAIWRSGGTPRPNVSDDAMERIVVGDRHFVAAVTANRCPHFF